MVLCHIPHFAPRAKNFSEVLNFEDHFIFSMTKYLIKQLHPVIYFLSSVLTLKNDSEIYVMRTHHKPNFIVEQTFLTPFSNYFSKISVVKTLCILGNP